MTADLDLIRRAANQMRELAVRSLSEDGDQAAKWTAIPALVPERDGWLVCHDPTYADYDTTVARAIYDYEGHVSRHVASWHPAVALAVADWLDDEASRIPEWATHYGPDALPISECPAAKVARAFLKEDTDV